MRPQSCSLHQGATRRSAPCNTRMLRKARITRTRWRPCCVRNAEERATGCVATLGLVPARPAGVKGTGGDDSTSRDPANPIKFFLPITSKCKIRCMPISLVALPAGRLEVARTVQDMANGGDRFCSPRVCPISLSIPKAVGKTQPIPSKNGVERRNREKCCPRRAGSLVCGGECEGVAGMIGGLIHPESNIMADTASAVGHPTMGALLNHLVYSCGSSLLLFPVLHLTERKAGTSGFRPYSSKAYAILAESTLNQHLRESNNR